MTTALPIHFALDLMDTSSRLCGVHQDLCMTPLSWTGEMCVLVLSCCTKQPELNAVWTLLLPLTSNAPSLIRSAQDHTEAKMPEELVMLTEATALHQAADWGMRALQGSFPPQDPKVVNKKCSFFLLACFATSMLNELASIKMEMCMFQHGRKTLSATWSLSTGEDSLMALVSFVFDTVTVVSLSPLVHCCWPSLVGRCSLTHTHRH